MVLLNLIILRNIEPDIYSYLVNYCNYLNFQRFLLIEDLILRCVNEFIVSYPFLCLNSFNLITHLQYKFTVLNKFFTHGVLGFWGFGVLIKGVEKLSQTEI